MKALFPAHGKWLFRKHRCYTCVLLTLSVGVYFFSKGVNLLIGKHLLGLENVDKKDIENILTTAESFIDIIDRDVKKFQLCEGKRL